MAKVTSKLQLTIPKAVAKQYSIQPGDEMELAPSGSFIRMVPSSHRREGLAIRERVKLFQQLLERHRKRRQKPLKARRGKSHPEADRGWKREDLYTRGSSR